MFIFKWLCSLWIIIVPFYVISESSITSESNYILPQDHPIKATLDDIFSSGRVLSSLEAMKAAGFISPHLRPKQLVIGIHPRLKGYLLKVYLDDNPIDEHAQWMKRINGALLIQNAITRWSFQSIMCVPKKWIYKIPTKDLTDKPSINRKQSILVVEDMHLASAKENAHFYKNEVTHAHLDALATIFIYCRLVDSLIIQNVPLTTKGKIAFVDTELAGKSLWIWLRIKKFGKYLSPEMNIYWRKIIQKNVKDK